MHGEHMWLLVGWDIKKQEKFNVMKPVDTIWFLSTTQANFDYDLTSMTMKKTTIWLSL